MELLTTSTDTVDICKKHGLSPNTFCPWREKFLDGGKAILAGSPSARTVEWSRRRMLPSRRWLARSHWPMSCQKKKRFIALIVKNCPWSGNGGLKLYGRVEM